MAQWLRGRPAEAERALSPAVAERSAVGEGFLAAWGCHVLGQVQRAQGRLDAAVRTCRRTLEITAPPGRSAAPAARAAHVGLAEVAYQRNELDVALQHVTKGIALCRQLVYAAPLATGLVTLAWIRQATGDQVGALDAIGEAAQFAPGPAVNGLLNPVPAERARLLLAQGDLAGAARWTTQKGLGADDEPRYPSEPEHLLLARVLLAQGRPLPVRARAAGPAVRGRGRPGPDRQCYRGRCAAGAGAGRQRRGCRRGSRPGRSAHPGVPTGLRPGLRR